MTMHTPGLWYVDSDGKTIATDEVEVACCYSSEDLDYKSGSHLALTDDVVAANARLIAAAPDLLAALVGLVDLGPPGVPPEDLDDLGAARFGAAKAAITRATECGQ